MNIGAMNAAGGPVGGNMPMANNQRAGAAQKPAQDAIDSLNTYIYDHFLRSGNWLVARAIIKSGVTVRTVSKTSPNHRNGENNGVNGVDPNSMNTDSKDDADRKRPDDLLAAEMPPGQCNPDSSFLGDWWALFMEVFWTQRNRPESNSEMSQYLQQTQSAQRVRQDQQQQMLRMNQMNPAQLNQANYQNLMRITQGKALNQELQRAAVVNRSMGAPNQMQMAKMQQQMRREGSDVDINGQPRPQSPASMENAPSPSKRQRLDNVPMNGEAMRQNGMSQPVGASVMNSAREAVRAQNVLIQGGVAAGHLSPGQFNQFQAQPAQIQNRAIQLFQDKAMSHNGMRADGQPMPAMPGEFYQQSIRQGGMNPAVPNGNHALQDYQMQLILLEQQNKKRLQQARQEQANGGEMRSDQPGAPGGGQGQVGQGNFAALSPGSRNGNSPNPSDQIKRGTPKLNQAGIPGSPMGDGSMTQSRDSPNGPPMMFNGAANDPASMLMYQQQMKNDGMMNNASGMLMRPPPSSHPANFQGGQMAPEFMAARARAAGQVPGQQNWQQGMGGQPMMQNPSQGGQQPQPQQMGTPRQNNMPPPQAVPAPGAANNARTQPSSPQSTVAPPTPQQTNKAAPKATKKAAAKKGAKKNAANTAATPSSEAAEPPTPTTAVTPAPGMHPNNFSGKNTVNGPAATGANGQVASAAPPAPATNTVPPQQPDANAMSGYPQMGDSEQPYALEFTTLGDPDVLTGLDFDTFLNDDINGANTFFDGNMNFDAGGVEMGTGES
ncbi:MAG: hypothetical protein M1814_005032 [Vezdaea aestivalis]|nr:MAG: hypothetical protein M1814_005032 [Vezdaea aestivalis]